MFVIPLLRFCDDEAEVEALIKIVEATPKPRARITFQNITETRQNVMVSPFVVNFQNSPLQKNYVYSFRLCREFFKKIQPLLNVQQHHFIGIDALDRFVLRTFYNDVTSGTVRTQETGLIDKGDTCFTTFRFGQSRISDD